MSTQSSPTLQQQLAHHRAEAARIEQLLAQGSQQDLSLPGTPRGSLPSLRTDSTSSTSSLASTASFLSLPPAPLEDRKLTSALELFDSLCLPYASTISPRDFSSFTSKTPSSAHSILDEPWAQSRLSSSSSSSSSSSLSPPLPSWMHNWPHPYPSPPIVPHDLARSEAASSHALLATADSGGEDIFARLCQLARLIFGVQFAAVNIVERDVVTFRAASITHPPLVGMTGAPRNVSLCNYTVAKGSTLVIPDLAREAATKDNPLTTQYACRFYAGSPLTTARGVHLGTFCLLDPQPNDRFGSSAQAVLELLATTAMSQLELTRMKKNRDRFFHHILTNVSHELRTPTHAILGLCELVLEQPLTRQQAEYIAETRDQAREMLSLVNDLLDFASADAGQLRLTPTVFHPHELFRSACAQLQTAAECHRVQFRIFQPYPPHIAAFGDRQRIAQLLLNLLSNAIKFSRPDHYIDVRVTHHAHRPVLTLVEPRRPSYIPSLGDGSGRSAAVAPSPEAGGLFWMYVRVVDEGMGISEQRLSAVFDVLQQEDAVDFKRRFDGAGLGLTLCRRLTELMDGAMMIESEKDHGSAFHVVLPLRYATPTLPSVAALTTAEVQSLLTYQPPPLTSLHFTSDPSPTTAASRRLTNFNNREEGVIRPGRRHAHSTSDPPALTDTEQSVRAPPPLTAGLRAHSLSTSPLPTVRSVAPRTVLVVDDNGINLRVAQRMLAPSHQCVCVQSGREALEVVQSRWVDAVLMDVQMPEMDGLEATRRIRALERDGRLFSGGKERARPRLPIIALTASEGAAVMTQCLDSGMDECIFKPCSKDQMLHIVAHATNKAGSKEISAQA